MSGKITAIGPNPNHPYLTILREDGKTLTGVDYFVGDSFKVGDTVDLWDVSSSDDPDHIIARIL